MINKILLAVSALTLTGLTLYHLSSTSTESSLRLQFMQYKQQFKKSYGSPSELEYRFQVFKTTLNRINKNNSNPQKTHKAGVNKFSDLTFSEFKTMYLTDMNKSADMNSTAEIDLTKGAKVDWRQKKGAVGAVKNQEQCGSCWAFSTVASLETAYWQKNQKSVSLSEQELVDCSTSYGNYGCNGGLMNQGYDYIVDNKIGTEKAYPYRAIDQNCSAKKKKKAGRVGVSSYSFISPANVKGLIAAAKKQVVSVAIEVQDDFMDYSSGVYTNDDYCGSSLNHGVAVVGFNTKAKVPYFIVRNSWGPGWGDNGYIKMAVASGAGTCGIANESDVYPQL
jgi:C1A family cysteine protease